MIQTHTRQRIDVLLDAPLCDWLVDLAAEAGIVHHSVVAVESGVGRAGPWRDDGFGTVPKRLFIAVTNAAKVEALLDRIAPAIESHGLMVTVHDVQVIRGERF